MPKIQRFSFFFFFLLHISECGCRFDVSLDSFSWAVVLLGPLTTIGPICACIVVVQNRFCYQHPLYLYCIYCDRQCSSSRLSIVLVAIRRYLLGNLFDAYFGKYLVRDK